MHTEVRSPAFAGSFYPSDAGELRALVERWLNLAAPKSEVPPAALLAPHARFEYSGETASRAYALVRGHGFRRVVVLAPSHFEEIHFASVYSGSGYESPLGLVKCDRDFADRLEEECRVFRASRRGHIPPREHSLEVHMPFLQVALGEFELVAVAVGELNASDGIKAGKALSRLCEDGNTLLIASSDLSHYHPAAAAEELDHLTVEAIQTGDAMHFIQSVERDHLDLCGQWAVAIALAAMPQRSWRLLHYSTSADVMGERGAVEGYASMACY